MRMEDPGIENECGERLLALLEKQVLLEITQLRVYLNWKPLAFDSDRVSLFLIVMFHNFFSIRNRLTQKE